MFINRVISYKGGWELVNKEYSLELGEVIDAIDENMKARGSKDEMRKLIRELKDCGNLDYFDSSLAAHLFKKGWKGVTDLFNDELGKKINFKRIGPVKRGISVSSPIDPFGFLTRWLFLDSSLAIRYRCIELPILVLSDIPRRSVRSNIDSELVSPIGSGSKYKMSHFEFVLDELKVLSPIHLGHPFLVLGYAEEESDFEIFEIESSSSVEGKDYGEEDIKRVDRCIEFPPEYHQAGINLLTFFGTYLKKQYPNEDATVRIEQDGLLVRLIVEAKDGKKEMIERALQEYQLIIFGTVRPEVITQDELLILDIRNELRIAATRIEAQKDLIALQNITIGSNRLIIDAHKMTIDTQKVTIEGLMEVIKLGLKNKASVHIDFKPVISLSGCVVMHQQVSPAVSSIGELIRLFPVESNSYEFLKDLEQSLRDIEHESDAGEVKRSPVMSKWKRFVEMVSEGDSDIGKIIKAANGGWKHVQLIAGKYNSIAEWCGLPLIPKIFTK